MRTGEFLRDHASWLLAFVCFCYAFGGIFAKTIWRLPWRLFELDWPEEYLLGYSAVLVGVAYLIAGVVVLFDMSLGAAGVVGALLLTWILGTFVPQRHGK